MIKSRIWKDGDYEIEFLEIYVRYGDIFYNTWYYLGFELIKFNKYLLKNIL